MLELKQELTKSDIQSVLRLSKLLSDLSNNFKTYHFTVVNQLQDNEEVVSEQEVLDDHGLKVMKLVDCIGELIGEPSQTKTVSGTDLLVNPQPSVSSPASKNNCLIHRQLDLSWNSVQIIRRAV